MMNSFRTLTRCIILRKKILSPRSAISFEHLSRQMGSHYRKHWGENKESLWSENGRNKNSDDFLRKEVENFDEEEVRTPRPPHKLIADLSDETIEKITEGFAVRKLRLHVISNSMKFLESKGFPLPDSMTEAQYEQILKYETKMGQTLYLDAIVEGQDQNEEALKKIMTEEKYLFQPLQVDPEILEELVGSDVEKKAQWERVLFHHEKLQINSPEGLWPFLVREEVDQLMACVSESKIIKALLFFDLNNAERFRDWIKKKGKTVRYKARLEKKFEEEAEILESGQIIYGLGHNNMLMRVYDQTIEKWCSYRVWRESMEEWGQPLVIDVSWFNSNRYQQQKSLCLRELPFSTSYNKASTQPFHLHYTSVCDQRFKDLMTKVDPLAMTDGKPEVYTEQSYLDIFPKEKIVYLSPDSRNELQWDDDDVYVIGGLVDVDIKSNASLGKAKKEGVRHAHLPLRRVLGMQCILNIEHMVAIMCDYRLTKDWMYAFRWIPPRHFRSRLKSSPYTSREESVYLAHKQLHPNMIFGGLHGMGPTAYREKYIEMLKAAPNDRTLHDPQKYSNPRPNRERGLMGKANKMNIMEYSDVQK